MADNLTAEHALQKLIEGNRRYMDADYSMGNVSRAIRLRTSDHGQTPYAIILGCSDSRVMPESIFSADLGDLFVIRVAGNVVDDHQMGSVEYAADHLGCKLVVVLGHDNCGAVHAAIHHDPDGHIKYITDEINLAIGSVKDEYEASWLNVKRSVRLIETNIDMITLEEHGVKVLGAMYHLRDGHVEFREF